MVEPTSKYIKTVSITDLPIWEQAKHDRTLLSVVLELTARCNNDCVHCYINQPTNDIDARSRELTLQQIKKIIDESISLGALWFVLSGGEPLLRPDFSEIYMYLKKKGALVTIFTNASLITEDHIKLFKKYPPRGIEVTIYGVGEKVHRRVTRKQTFAATNAGVNKLLLTRLPVTLKTTVMKSNFEEFDQIAEFCNTRSDLPFRFDPMLQYRLDRDTVKNSTIKSERLSVDEIRRLEQKDPARYKRAIERCTQGDVTRPYPGNGKRIFRCRVGVNSCCVDFTGNMKLCSSLVNKDCVFDLKDGSFAQAWIEKVPEILKLESNCPQFAGNCGDCKLHDICSWCPAHADLETSKLDGHIDYFCTVAKNKIKEIPY